MIPTLTLTDLAARAPRTLDAVREATRQTGVFYLDGGQAAGQPFFNALFDAARRFFALPPEAKQRLSIAHSASYRGYVAVGQETTNGKEDLKESFEFGKETPAPAAADPPPYFLMYGGNQWPDEDELPGFRRAIEKYSAYIDLVGVAVIEALASTLGQPGVLGSTAAFGAELCSFARLIYYEDPREFSQDAARLEAHTDSGMITVSAQDCAGLEVRTAGGQWIEVTPPDGTCVVFTGELMELWSGGYYPACVHRVHNKALRRERLSAITFFIPDLRSVLTPLDPAASPALAAAGSVVPVSNSWLTAADRAVAGDGPGQQPAAAPFVVGEREWDRVHAIFDEGPAGAARASKELQWRPAR